LHHSRSYAFSFIHPFLRISLTILFSICFLKAASAKESPELGISVAIGIFIHNVPEGIAISGKFWGINRK